MSPASITHLDHPTKAGSGRIASIARAASIAALAGSMLTACETMNSTMESMKTSMDSMNLFGGEDAAHEQSAAPDPAQDADPRRLAVAEAGVEPVPASDVERYMDEQERKLRARLEGTGVSIMRDGAVITLLMPGSVTFASGSSNLDERFHPVLDSVVVVIDEFARTYVDIVGHTDSNGPTEYNKRLSVLRAQSVARYLEERRVTRQRLLADGMGEDAPIASNDTREGRAMNRRVEIKLKPVT
jgi:outer membrane protein OmpA-like peptidoglycan-associated protein